MVGTSITITRDEIGPALDRIIAFTQDLSPVLESVGEDLVNGVLRRFRSGRAPDGAPWKPSARALRQPAPGEKKGRTLVKFGYLRDSISSSVEGNSVVVGTNVVYAAIHQFGGKAGRGRKVTIPARPYLGVDAGDRRAIIKTVRKALIAARGRK